MVPSNKTEQSSTTETQGRTSSITGGVLLGTADPQCPGHRLRRGAWRKPLLRLRPHIHYLGFDSSHYAVNRYGLQRNLHLAQIGDFSWLRPCAPVDLLVCADVLHYVATRELTRALPGLVELCNGVAFLEIFTAEDAFEGDTTGFQSRQARWYRRRFTAAGFTALGSHCWLSPVLAGHTTALEHN